MKTVIYFVFTCLISTGALLGNLHAANPYPGFAVMVGIWALFFWGWNRRKRKEDHKRYYEQRFADYMRSQPRRPYR